jgi:hypothetical protein
VLEPLIPLRPGPQSSFFSPSPVFVFLHLLLSTMEREDYSFLFEPPKDSDLFTRVPRSPDTGATQATSIPQVAATGPSALGDSRYAATLSKFTTGFLSSNSAASETVAPFLNEHIHGQVHIPDNRTEQTDNERAKVYCYRHQPDLRCTRRTPQEDTVAEIQRVNNLHFGFP